MHCDKENDADDDEDDVYDNESENYNLMYYKDCVVLCLL